MTPKPTTSGRLPGEPNLQRLPPRTKIGQQAQTQAARHGHVLLEVSLEQLELQILAREKEGAK